MKLGFTSGKSVGYRDRLDRTRSVVSVSLHDTLDPEFGFHVCQTYSRPGRVGSARVRGRLAPWPNTERTGLIGTQQPPWRRQLQ